MGTMYVMNYVILPCSEIYLCGNLYIDLFHLYGDNFTMVYTNYFGLLNIIRLFEFYFVVLPILKDMRTYLKVKDEFLAKSTDELKQ
jgi:hypothetical protein